MGEQVGFQVAPLAERNLTDGTLVAVALTVQDLVNGKGPRLAETLLTCVALVRLLLGVNVSVIPQMVLPSEALSTNVAGEWPLVSMGSLVDHHIVALGELSVAELADEPLLGAGASGMSKVESRVVGGRRRGRGGKKS